MCLKWSVFLTDFLARSLTAQDGVPVEAVVVVWRCLLSAGGCSSRSEAHPVPGADVGTWLQCWCRDTTSVLCNLQGRTWAGSEHGIPAVCDCMFVPWRVHFTGESSDPYLYLVEYSSSVEVLFSRALGGNSRISPLWFLSFFWSYHSHASPDHQFLGIIAPLCSLLNIWASI